MRLRLTIPAGQRFDVKRQALLSGLVAIFLPLLVGCGGSDEPQLVFPAGEINPAGEFYVPIADRERARELCEASDRWPAEYPDQVTFDFPATGRDLTCLR